MNRKCATTQGFRSSLCVILAALISLSTRPARAAEPSPTRAQLQSEIAKLTKALAECQSGDKRDAQQREQAVASLRAVASALDTGANLEEFKRYQIESRIKIDALPNTADNRPTRDVSDLFADAVHFRIIYTTDGRIEADDIAAAKERYASDVEIAKTLNDMQSEDAIRALKAEPIQNPITEQPRSERGKELAAEVAESTRQLQEHTTQIMRERARARNAEHARHISVLLILHARLKLLDLK
jgi:hypothetical protein